MKTRDSRRDRWEHQNEHFVRDFLQFSHFVASKSTFSYEFSLEPENLQPQNRCFVRSFRQFSAHCTKCHACHGICTLSKQVVVSFCVAGVALCNIPTYLITCRKYQAWRKSRTKCSFFCTHVSRLESLVFLWRRPVYGEAPHSTLYTPQFTL